LKRHETIQLTMCVGYIVQFTRLQPVLDQFWVE